MPASALTLDAGRVLAWRIGAQQLDRDPHAPTGGFDDCTVLDLGVRDTGADGAGWALVTGGCFVEATGLDADSRWSGHCVAPRTSTGAGI